MKTDLSTLSFEGAAVRTVWDDGDLYWVAKDVCNVLGYANDSDAISTHCKGVAKRYPLATPGGTQEVRIISEPDLLRLIVGSHLPAAEKFERWVFEEVLPSIRKTGAYGISNVDVRHLESRLEVAEMKLFLKNFLKPLDCIPNRDTIPHERRLIIDTQRKIAACSTHRRRARQTRSRLEGRWFFDSLRIRQIHDNRRRQDNSRRPARIEGHFEKALQEMKKGIDRLSRQLSVNAPNIH